MTVNGCQQKLSPTLRRKSAVKKQQQQDTKPPKETKWHNSIIRIQGGAQDADDENSKKEKDEKNANWPQSFPTEMKVTSKGK